MNEEHIKWISLFFYYAFLDERLALQASHKTLRRVQARIKKTGIAQEDLVPAIVYECFQVWGKLKKSRPIMWPGLEIESGWDVPKSVDLSIWRDFLKDVDGDTVISVIFMKVLRLRDVDIARGLGVTVGTLRYRVGNGIRQLGLMAQPGVLPL